MTDKQTNKQTYHCTKKLSGISSVNHGRLKNLAEIAYILGTGRVTGDSLDASFLH